MKRKDVVIGKKYIAKVSSNLVPVRIIGESPYGGWDAVNTVTGRQARIKTAGRLRRESDPGYGPFAKDEHTHRT
jgi:hypothetical protein